MSTSLCAKIFEIGPKLTEIVRIKVLTHSDARYFPQKIFENFSLYPLTGVVGPDTKNENISKSGQNWSNADWGDNRKDPSVLPGVFGQ